MPSKALGENVVKARKIIPVVTARRPSFESGLRYRSDDWLGNFLSIPNSFVLRRIRFHLASNTAFCALILALHRIYPKSIVSIPPLGHSLLGGFMSLLLVFRTNSAYARFWEARGVWTKTMSTCRNLALHVVNYMQHTSPKSASHLLELLVAFPDALRYSCLSGFAPLPDHVEEVLQSSDHVEEVSQPSQPALALCHQMHMAVHDASIESPSCQTDIVEGRHLTEISHEINMLVDTLSSCEKIVKTPVPLSYSRHTSRFLTLWCGTLPFALLKQFGSIATLFVVFSSCWCLFGIEEIGHLIEQPFVGDSEDPNKDSLCSSPKYKRAVRTKPYDIGLPVAILAKEVRNEITSIIKFAKACGH